MRTLAEACEAIAATTKKLQKTTIVADYLKSRTADEAAVSAVFLSGRAFPAWEETTLQVGGSLLWRAVAELSGKDEAALTASYRKHGDLGSVAGEVLAQQSGQGLNVLQVVDSFHQIAAARGPAAKTALVRDLLARAMPLEAKYIVKIMTGDLRIGLKENLVEEAIAKAYVGTPAATLHEVQRANMLLGDIGETLRLAVEGKLADAKMRMFHPIGFMLASPIESPDEGLSYFPEAVVEDKYDGIRAQAHISGGEVKLFSRTRDEITDSFPELPGALAGYAAGCDSRWRDRGVGGAGAGAAVQRAAATLRAEESQRANASRDSGGVLGVRRSVYGRRVADRSSAAGAGATSWMSFWRKREPTTETQRARRRTGTQEKLIFGGDEEIEAASIVPSAGVSREIAAGTGRTICCGTGARERRLDDQGPRLGLHAGEARQGVVEDEARAGHARRGGDGRRIRSRQARRRAQRLHLWRLGRTTSW